MKRLFTTAILTAACLAMNAQAISDGYYRVKNSTTNRWAVLCDDKADVDEKVAGTSAVDLAAIRTYLNFDRIVYDPGSVIKFIYVQSGNGYTLAAQGTDTQTMLAKTNHPNYYLSLRASGRTYMASATAMGFNIHLADQRLQNDADVDSMGYMLPAGDNQYWFINALDASSSDNYFGFKPTLTLGNKHYLPFYASFGFTAYSDGIKAYYVDQIDEYHGNAELREITGESFPAETPMIIETTGATPADNKVNVIDGTATVPADNLLTGVYFCSARELLAWWDQPGKDHEVYTLNDPETMRVLGIDHGHLALVKSTAKYIPANSFYLKVESSCPDVLRLLNADDYVTGISTVKASETKAENSNVVFNLNGQQVSSNGIEGLAPGIYIQNGKKLVVK